MSGVKCTNNFRIRVICLFLGVMTAMGSVSCGRQTYDMPYDPDAAVSGFNVISRQNSKAAHTFAENLCVVTDNVLNEETVDMTQAEAAVLFDLSDCQVLYAKNAHERLHPASLTKVMTALVALKYGQLNQTLTASDVVNITESGAVLCGLAPGDTMTLDQALRILLVFSANDVAMLIAENVGGSVERFVEMMNEEAARLGATNTHFTNPHGLTESEHYTTVYDLYLIFNEAVRNDTFNEIIHMSSYQTVFYDRNGKEKAFDRQNSNQYLRGERQAPANVTVIGGKTGTTNAAGYCLMLFSRDENGRPYISIVLRAEGVEELYGEMTDLLDEIHK